MAKAIRSAGPAIWAPASATSATLRSMRHSAACGRDCAPSSTVTRSSIPRSRTRSATSPASGAAFGRAGSGTSTVRRDAGRFSYGFELNDNQRITFYRTDEFDTNFNRGAYMTAFFEYRPSPRHRDQLRRRQCCSIPTAARDRILFSPNRAQPDSVFEEFRVPQSASRVPDHPEAELRRSDGNAGRVARQIGRGGATAGGTAKSAATSFTAGT